MMQIDNVPTDEVFAFPQGIKLREYLEETESLLNRFEMSLGNLPRVEEGGSSDCPFAEKLYAEKEALESQVMGQVTVLYGLLHFLKNQLKRCRHNLEVLGIDSSKLRLEGPIQQYSSAQVTQWDQFHLARKDHNAIAPVLEKAEALLQKSQQKKYPGKTPRKRSSVPDMPLEAENEAKSDSETSVTDHEIEDLLFLGPLP